MKEKGGRKEKMGGGGRIRINRDRSSRGCLKSNYVFRIHLDACMQTLQFSISKHTTSCFYKINKNNTRIPVYKLYTINI